MLPPKNIFKKMWLLIGSLTPVEGDIYQHILDLMVYFLMRTQGWVGREVEVDLGGVGD